MFKTHHHKSIEEQMKDNRLVSTEIYGIQDNKTSYEINDKDLSLDERLSKNHLAWFNSPQKYMY